MKNILEVEVFSTAVIHFCRLNNWANNYLERQVICYSAANEYPSRLDAHSRPTLLYVSRNSNVPRFINSRDFLTTGTQTSTIFTFWV